MARPLPGLAEVARSADKRVAFFYNWEQLRDLARPGNIHYAYFKDSSYDLDGDDETVSEAARFIPRHQPDFAFIYIGTVDTIGHAYGWMSDEYIQQLERIDSLLDGFFETLPSDYTSIIHSHHGGHDRYHGTDTDEDMIIPWIAVGQNIKMGHTIQSQVSLLDTAPTIAKLLEIQPHREWESRKQGLAKVRRDYEVYLVYVEAELGDSCGECVKMCPVDVFEMPHKAIPVRPVNCMGCRTCVALCKSNAIVITEI